AAWRASGCVGPARRVHQGAPDVLGRDGDVEGHLGGGDGVGGPEALAAIGRARLCDLVAGDVVPGDVQGSVRGYEWVGADDRPWSAPGAACDHRGGERPAAVGGPADQDDVV